LFKSCNMLSSLLLGTASESSKSISEFDPTSSFLSRPIATDLLIVDQESAKELQCGICLQLLEKPRQCKNGHLFCFDCITRSLEKNNECPLCRCLLRTEELSRSLFVEKHIRLLRVYCKYHFTFEESSGKYIVDEEGGCLDTCALENLDRHEATCGKAIVSCKYSDSCGKHRRHMLEAHEAACIYRPDVCPHCQADVPYNNMAEHFATCGMMPVQCQSCPLSVTRKDLDDHLRNSCPEQEIPCDFQEQGCEVKVLRKDLQQHLTADIVSHMSMMRKSYCDKLSQLKQDFEKECKIRDEKIRHLEKVVKDSETKIEWKIKNYSQLRKKSYIQSEKFDMAGFTWFIGVYADGDNPDSKGFISIYLFLDIGHIPKGKSITLEYYIKFVNHKDPMESIKKEFKSVFPIKAGQGWGDRKAICNHMLEQNGFIKDDTMIIEAEISVRKLTWAV